MSCVVADNSISALKIPLLDYLLLHKDPPSYLSDPHTAKTTDNTKLVHQVHQRAEQYKYKDKFSHRKDNNWKKGRTMLFTHGG